MKDKTGIWYYVASYRFKSIFIRNFLMIVSLVVSTIAGIGFFVNYYSSKTLNDEIAEYNMNSAAKIRDTVDNLFGGADELALNFSVDADVSRFINMNASENVNGGYADFIELVKTIQSKYALYSISGNYRNAVFIYSDALDYVIGNAGNTGARRVVFGDEWLDYYNEISSEKNFWIDLTSFQEDRNISLFRLLPMNSLSGRKGMIQINIAHNRIRSLIGSGHTVKRDDVYILNGDEIIYSKNTAFLGKKYTECDALKDLNISREQTVSRDFNGERQIISRCASDYNNFSYVLITPLTEYRWKTENMRMFLTYMIVLFLAFAILVSFYVSIRVFRPISDLLRVADSPDDFERELNSKSRTGMEISYLIKRILDFRGENKNMRNELAKHGKALGEMQKSALSAQISPHFLYNTLENIKWTAMDLTRGENITSQMITKLSRLLRISLSIKDNWITVNQEVEYTNLYLDIQKLRYGDGITVKYDIDEGIGDYAIPKFTLQPIVENALYHGIRPNGEHGIITLTGRQAGNNVIMRVTDDGKGLTAEELSAVRENLASALFSDEQKHIGLVNVNHRVKLLYGGEYGVEIANNPTGGCIVTITFPAMKKPI